MEAVAAGAAKTGAEYKGRKTYPLPRNLRPPRGNTSLLYDSAVLSFCSQTVDGGDEMVVNHWSRITLHFHELDKTGYLT